MTPTTVLFELSKSLSSYVISLLSYVIVMLSYVIRS